MSLTAGLILFIQMILRSEQDAVFADRAADEEERNMDFKLWPTLSWFAGLLIMTSLVGFILALIIFLLLFFGNNDLQNNCFA